MARVIRKGGVLEVRVPNYKYMLGRVRSKNGRARSKFGRVRRLNPFCLVRFCGEKNNLLVTQWRRYHLPIFPY